MKKKISCEDCRYYWQNCDTENECQGENEPCHEFILMNVHNDDNYSLDLDQIKWLIKRAEQADKMEKFLHEMREHYECIANSDHPLIEASNPLAGIEDFLVDELGWGIEE